MLLKYNFWWILISFHPYLTFRIERLYQLSWQNSQKRLILIVVGLVSGFPQFQLFVSNWNCHNCFSRPQLWWLSPRLQLLACLISEQNKVLTLINIIPLQQLMLSCRQWSSKKVKFAQVFNWSYSFLNVFSLKESKAKAKGEEAKEEVTAEDTDKEEVILFKLSDEDIEFIYDNTHYTLKDINDWHRLLLWKQLF